MDIKINYYEIGDNIRKERIRLEMTQEKAAEQADISTNYLSHIENGLSKFSFKTFIKIVNALHTTPNKLLKQNVLNERENMIEEICLIMEKFDNNKLMFLLTYVETLSEYDVNKSKK